jgi:hypothetical protein
VYKQLNAPFGDFAQAALTVSTVALASSAPGDATYTALEGTIAQWTANRDAIASQIRGMLDDAAFSGRQLHELPAKNLIAQAQALIDDAKAFAATLPAP